MFAELIFAAITLLAPADGAEVALLSETQRNYLALPRAERFAKFDDGAFRGELAKSGTSQQPVRFEWTGSTNAVYTFVIDSVSGGERQVYSITNRTFARVTNFEAGKHYRWAVRGPKGAAAARFSTAAEVPRMLYAEGVRNLRDCGGWKGLGGRRVRQGLVFRSAGLRNSSIKSGNSLVNVRYSPGHQRVTESGIAELRDDLRIRTDIELRNDREAICMKDTIIPGSRWVHIPFLAYDFVSDDLKGRAQFARIFREFLDPANYPVLFHCSGGRDRTGTLAFLLNGLLGVSEDDLCRDWEVTAFEDPALSFNTDRISRLLDFLHGLAGENINAQVESYVKSCGITDGDIAAFRKIMLEGGAE